MPRRKLDQRVSVAECLAALKELSRVTHKALHAYRKDSPVYVEGRKALAEAVRVRGRVGRRHD